MKTLALFVLSVVLCLGAKAEERISVNVGVPVVEERGYGHWETRVETVLVTPSSRESVWVAPVKVVTNGVESYIPGYWSVTVTPARYESRTVTVWVPERHHGFFGFRFGFSSH